MISTRWYRIVPIASTCSRRWPAPRSRWLLSGSLPAPPDLIKLLSPFASQGRLVGWSANADEQELFERMRMAGELPGLNGSDGLVVALDNIGLNKIDYYLTGELSYEVDTDPASGRVDATLDITLHNNVPAGVIEPAPIFANSIGAPPGTSGLAVTVYSALPVTGLTVDGQIRAADGTSAAHGFNLSTVNVNTSAQSTTQIRVQLAGPLDLADGYHLIIRNGPSVSPMNMTLVVDETVAEDLGAAAGIHRIGPDGHDG